MITIPTSIKTSLPVASPVDIAEASVLEAGTAADVNHSGINRARVIGAPPRAGFHLPRISGSSRALLGSVATFGIAGAAGGLLGSKSPEIVTPVTALISMAGTGLLIYSGVRACFSDDTPRQAAVSQVPEVVATELPTAFTV